MEIDFDNCSIQGNQSQNQYIFENEDNQKITKTENTTSIKATQKKKRKPYCKRNLDLDQIQQSGHWTFREQFTYLKFLKSNQEKFLIRQKRRKNKVFKTLSKLLKTRTPEQCRTHHQKMEIKYGEFLNIVKELTNQIEWHTKKQEKIYIKEQIESPTVQDCETNFKQYEQIFFDQNLLQNHLESNFQFMLNLCGQKFNNQNEEENLI